MDGVLGLAQGYSFQQWLRKRVRSASDTPIFPKSREEIDVYRSAVRKIFEKSAGSTPEYEPLTAEIHQTHQRNGYRIEAVSFPTFAGLRMTANAYIPDSDKPVPGILAVHGHSMHGRRDHGMQVRCTALAKSGYFVLAVDAFGNGERSVNLPGEYHGGLYAAALWLTGYSLFGIQIHENYRACDYLASRPEVDPHRLGISGASGGGNQSFYSGAWDNRFAAVVPVCCIGAYHKLVGTHNCMCETPFALAGTLEQFDILSLTAPRALLVISAKADSVSFRFEDAQETMKKAHKIWALLGYPEKMGFEALPITHGYPQIARERCLIWFNKWLKDSKDAKPIKEPYVPIEDYETLACYPRTSVSQVMTMPTFFSNKRAEVMGKNKNLTVESVKKIFSAPERVKLEIENICTVRSIIPDSPASYSVFKGRDGTLISALCHWPDCNLKAERTLILTGNSKEDFIDSAKKPLVHYLIQVALQNKTTVWIIDLPGLAEGKLPYSPEGGISASRACHLLGFSLAGYWLSLLQSLTETARKHTGSVLLYVSDGPATSVLAGSCLLKGIEKLVIENPLATYKTTDTFTNIPFEAIIPGLLTQGDIPDFAALRAPQPLTVIAPLAGNGSYLSPEEIHHIFSPVAARYAFTGRREAFKLMEKEEAKSAFLSGFFFV